MRKFKSKAKMAGIDEALAPRTTPLSVFRLSWRKTKRGHDYAASWVHVSRPITQVELTWNQVTIPGLKSLAGGERKNQNPDDRPIGPVERYNVLS